MTKTASFILLSAFIAFLFAVQIYYAFYNAGIEPVLRYDNTLLVKQWWRSLTHAFIHLNFSHLFLNVAGLACIYSLFEEAFENSLWFVALLFSTVVSAAGMYLFSPEVHLCVGLSGGLHGLFIYAIIRDKAHWVWLVAFAAKLAQEQFAWFSDLQWSNVSSDFIEGNIVYDAHLWGTVGGIIFLIFYSVAMLFTLIEVNKKD